MKKFFFLCGALLGNISMVMNCMEQKEFPGWQKKQGTITIQQKQVPTLKDLALEKLVEKKEMSGEIEVSSTPYDQLILDLNYEKKLKDGGSLEQIINWLDVQGRKKDDYDFDKSIQMQPLIKKVPSLFFESFMDSSISINEFIAQVSILSSELSSEIAKAFFDQINNFMTRDEITQIELTIPTKTFLLPREIVPVIHEAKIDPKTEKVIEQSIETLDPVLTMVSRGEKGLFSKIYPEIVIIPDLEFLVPIFIGQQLQLLLIQKLENTGEIQSRFNKGEPIIDSALQEKITSALLQIGKFVEAYKDMYPGLNVYFDKINELFSNLSQVDRIRYRKFVWDEDIHRHIREMEENPVHVLKKIF